MFHYPRTKFCPRGQNVSVLPICLLLTTAHIDLVLYVQNGFRILYTGTIFFKNFI